MAALKRLSGGALRTRTQTRHHTSQRPCCSNDFLWPCAPHRAKMTKALDSPLEGPCPQVRHEKAEEKGDSATKKVWPTHLFSSARVRSPDPTEKPSMSRARDFRSVRATTTAKGRKARSGKGGGAARG